MAASIMHRSLCILWHLLALVTTHTARCLRRVDLAKVVNCIWVIGCRYIPIDMTRILHAACHLLHQRQIMIDTLWEYHHRLCRRTTTKSTSLPFIIDQCHQVLGTFPNAFFSHFNLDSEHICIRTGKNGPFQLPHPLTTSYYNRNYRILKAILQTCQLNF